MQSFYRTLKEPMGTFNGFIMRALKNRKFIGQPALKPRRKPNMTGRPPRVSADTTSLFLFAFLPTVHAYWTPFKKKEDFADGDFIPRSALRLRDKKNLKLRQDIEEADRLYDTGNTANYEIAFSVLMHQLNATSEAEVMWRAARLIYEKTKLVKSTAEKQRLLDDAYALLSKSIEIDEENFAVHKWMAIVTNELSNLKGLKYQILESFNVRNHMLRAVELNPNDATSIYMLGHWCYTVADVPWYQKKLAETLFATPPECTFTEAYKHFLQAEKTEPGFYSMNMLMLAKSCIKNDNMELAFEYLQKLRKYKAKKEGRQLLEKLFKASHYKVEGESAEEDKS